MVTSKRLQKLVHHHRFDSGYLMLPYAQFFAYGMLRKHLSNSTKTLGKPPKVRFLSSPLKNPGFPRVFRISGQLLWLSCLSMHVHACRCCVVSCAALAPGESSSESPESSPNPRFSRENRLFCSGGAGFELGEFESYWYSMLEQICRACSHHLSIQDAQAETAYRFID
jgi:hypothetical protein